MALGYWASIIQQGASQVQRPLRLKWIERCSIAVIFGFYLVFDMCLFTTKGFYGTGMAYIQMLMSACFLAAISAVFLVYGLRVLTRLRHFEKQKKIFDERNRAYDRMETARSFDMNAGDSVSDIALVEDAKKREKRLRKAEKQNSHAHKIVKILVVVESFAVIAVGAQVSPTTRPQLTAFATSRGVDTIVCMCDVDSRCTSASAAPTTASWSSTALTVWAATESSARCTCCTSSR